MTRVLHVFRYFHPRFTGEGVFVQRLAPVFARLRPDVHHDVLVTDTPSAGPPSPPPAGIGRVRYLARSADGASQPQIVAWLARNGRQYAVVHNHTHVDRTFLGALLLKLQGCRLVQSATLDDSVPGLLATYRPGLRPLVQRLFGLIDAFVAISPKLHEETSRLVPAARSHRIPMGIPLPGVRRPTRARERLDLPAEASVLVCVGGICERKDQLFLVEQLPALVARHPKLVLLLVGPVLDPAYLARIEAAVAARGLQSHVRFTGHAPDPGQFYTAADIFVLASRSEGFGTVVIEAMAHGLPVVVRRLAGVNDSFVKDGRTGFLFSDAGDFQRRVGDLLDAPGLRRRIGARARCEARARFDLADVAARYLAIYGYPARPRP
jgi:glycosyltransferase involved in cell wall biosynthesis